MVDVLVDIECGLNLLFVFVPCAVRSPTLLEGPANKTLSEGDPLLLFCTLLGLPRPEIRWFVNRQFIFQYLDSSTINIPSVNGDHAGEYHCTGTNSEGMETSPVAVIRVLCK